MIDFFETAGVKTKMERGGRMFPVSDHSSDIIRVLEQQMKKAGVKIHLGSRVKRLLVEKKRTEMQESPEFSWITEKRSGANRYWLPPAVILSVHRLHRGRIPDGKESGHTVTDLQPSLVPMVTAEEYIPRLQGLSLKNVTLSLYDGKNVSTNFGK